LNFGNWSLFVIWGLELGADGPFPQKGYPLGPKPKGYLHHHSTMRQDPSIHLL
jgi:hypothetical protein